MIENMRFGKIGIRLKWENCTKRGKKETFIQQGTRGRITTFVLERIQMQNDRKTPFRTKAAHETKTSHNKRFYLPA